jgi:mono/diheme cytochrome c family protein
MQSKWLMPVALLAGLAAAPALAEGDESAGWALATEYCASCHDISIGAPAKTFPPSFASIAVFRSPEQIYARTVFPATHTGMPNVAFYLLAEQDVEHLIAYIVSLEPRPEMEDDAEAEEAAPQ